MEVSWEKPSISAKAPCASGESPDADIHIAHPEVSRSHCEILVSKPADIIRDLRSANGTYVNGVRVREHLLHDGDQIRIGQCVLKYLAPTNIERSYHARLHRMTTLDGLTQIYNKRYFVDALDREIARARRHRRSLSLMMLDVDHFKTINDTHGHLAGDRVLGCVALAIKSNVRREDILARYGGDEFGLILSEIDHDRALVLGQRICQLIARTPLRQEEKDITVTLSIGVAALEPAIHSADELTRIADERLYRAKRAGRNRVVGAPQKVGSQAPS